MLSKGYLHSPATIREKDSSLWRNYRRHPAAYGSQWNRGEQKTP